jgi:hypothetical protein
MLAAIGKLAPPRMAHQVNRRDLAIIMSISIPKAPAATKDTLDSHHCYHHINPHKVTAMASSTLERLIVDYKTRIITLVISCTYYIK